MPFEDFEHVRKLGQGSFGSVYLTRNRCDNRHYVMKIIDTAQLGGEKGREEALREVSFLAKLNHPHIIGYREWFEHEDKRWARGHRKKLYIVMDYADGGDLSKRIEERRGRPFPEAQIVDWLVQMCLALKHMHDRKVIHRDIKSENIFLTKRNHVRVGDFGISKNLAHTAAHAHTRIGTPYYLSPEICLDRPYNSKTDMWSLGVVLYELMCLRHPFDADSMEKLLDRIVNGQHHPVSRRYSAPLRGIVKALLRKDPRRRPTVNKILALPLIARRVPAFLSSEVMAEEFSHTVLHSNAGRIRAPRNLPAEISEAVQREQQQQLEQQQQHLAPLFEQGHQQKYESGAGHVVVEPLSERLYMNPSSEEQRHHQHPRNPAIFPYANRNSSSSSNSAARHQRGSQSDRNHCRPQKKSDQQHYHQLQFEQRDHHYYRQVQQQRRRNFESHLGSDLTPRVHHLPPQQPQQQQRHAYHAPRERESIDARIEYFKQRKDRQEQRLRELRAARPGRVGGRQPAQLPPLELQLVQRRHYGGGNVRGIPSVPIDQGSSPRYEILGAEEIDALGLSPSARRRARRSAENDDHHRRQNKCGHEVDYHNEAHHPSKHYRRHDHVNGGSGNGAAGADGRVPVFARKRPTAGAGGRYQPYRQQPYRSHRKDGGVNNERPSWRVY